ncbi:hypothetical protein H0H92_010163 [Tricholoma furcatifolium]|nr:hypothetical protein H0H92_010163 [Tricholoma furcatifolium]
MLAIALLSSVLVISAYGYPRFWSSQTVLENDKFSQLDHDPICVQIEQATSSGTHVFYPGKGGSILYDFSQIAAVKSATLAYSESVIDPKAALITSYITTEYGKIAAWHLDAHFFYDGSIPPVVIFDDFLAIPYIEKNVFSRDFLSLVQSFPAGDEFGRAIYDGTPILGYTSKILDAIANETVFWSDHLKRFGVTYVDYGVQPFLPTAFDRGVHGSSAYPPSQNSVCPFHLYFAWSDVRFDEIFHEAARQSAAHLAGVAAAEGQDVATSTAAIYPNYAMFDTPLEAMYGGNLHALRTLQKFVDPEDVMGLAGGFKF